MFSYGEILLTIAAAIALCGPKDVPIVARTAGRLVGRAVGYIQEFRGQVDTVMKRSQVDQVHKELQEAMSQLEAIRHEIRSGMSISSYGPLTKHVEHSEVNRNSLQAEPPQHRSVTAASTSTTPSSLALGFSSVIESTRIHCGQDGTFNSIPPSTSRISLNRVDLIPHSTANVAAETFEAMKDVSQHGTGLQLSSVGDVTRDINVLPISAVSAGILPSRTGPVQGGADLLHESIIERTVAFDAKKFLQQSDLTV